MLTILAPLLEQVGNHEQVNTDHQLQPVIPWKRKTPITKVKFCQTLVPQSVCNSLKKK